MGYSFLFLYVRLYFWFENWTFESNDFVTGKQISPTLQGLLFAAVFVYCCIFLIAAVCLCAEDQPNV